MTRPDALIVPGGGVRQGGVLPPWAANRFDRAIEIHKGEPIVCLSGGTPHRAPPLDAAGRPIFEAVAGARYLMSCGVDPKLIYTETSSYDTIGNALFTRLLHTDTRGWKRLVVITSAFHMDRTRQIFRWIFSLAPERGYELEFDSAPDTGMSDADLAFRQARERASLESVRALEPRLRDMAAVHRWLFTEHLAYAASAFESVPKSDADLERVY